MSLTQTTTTTTTTAASRVEALQQRLQSVQQVRFRASAAPPMAMPMAMPMASVAMTAGMAAGMSSGPAVPTLTRRFSFVWPFISKENVAGSEPFLKSRCSQLLRQFPAFISARQHESTRTVRDVISRVLTQLKAVWLVLAVYMSLALLLCLCSTVLYTLLLAAKPPGLVFLVACVAATGAIAGVSFNAKARPRPKQQQPQQQQQQQQQQQVQQVQQTATLQVPKLTVN